MFERWLEFIKSVSDLAALLQLDLIGFKRKNRDVQIDFKLH